MYVAGTIFSFAYEDHVSSLAHALPGKTALFLSFPYVCPEPVLVKECILYINGSKSAVFLPRLDSRLAVLEQLAIHAVRARRHLASGVSVLRKTPFPQLCFCLS